MAWLLLLPFALVGVPLVLLVSPSLGDIAFPPPSLHYWSPEFVVRKPAVQAGYLLLLGLVFAYGASIIAAVRCRPRVSLAGRRAAVLVAQLLVVALIVVAWVAQRRLDVLGTRRVYFTPASIIAAVVIAAALVHAARAASRMSRASTTWRRPSARTMRGLCLGVAILVVGVWILPAVYTDRGCRR